MGYKLTCEDTRYACGLQGRVSIKWIKYFKDIDNAKSYSEKELKGFIVWKNVGSEWTSGDLGNVCYRILEINCED